MNLGKLGKHYGHLGDQDDMEIVGRPANLELREDGSIELREDGSYELRE